MGSRRLHLTAADAKLHVQAISGLHPRAIGRRTESPPQSARIPDESDLHDPPTDFGIQPLPAACSTGEILPSASCHEAVGSGRHPTTAQFDNLHPEKRQHTRGAHSPAPQLRNCRRKAEPSSRDQGNGTVLERLNRSDEKNRCCKQSFRVEMHSRPPKSVGWNSSLGTCLTALLANKVGSQLVKYRDFTTGF